MTFKRAGYAFDISDNKAYRIFNEVMHYLKKRAENSNNDEKILNSWNKVLLARREPRYSFWVKELEKNWNWRLGVKNDNRKV